MTIFALHLMLKYGMRPFEVRGVLEKSGVIGCALAWMTPAMASDLRTERGNRGVFARVLTVEPVQRNTEPARFLAVPDWLFDMWEAQDRRGNGGPPLDP